MWGKYYKYLHLQIPTEFIGKYTNSCRGACVCYVITTLLICKSDGEKHKRCPHKGKKYNCATPPSTYIILDKIANSIRTLLIHSKNNFNLKLIKKYIYITTIFDKKRQFLEDKIRKCSQFNIEIINKNKK